MFFQNKDAIDQDWENWEEKLKNLPNMDKNVWMQDFHANMWRFNGNGFIALINSFIGFKQRKMFEWIIEDIKTNFETKIVQKPTKDITFVDLLKYEILNLIIKENDANSILFGLNSIFDEFFSHLNETDPYDENLEKSKQNYLNSF